MTRKPFVLALLLVVGAAACGRAEGTAIDLGSGLRFVAEVVDPLNDAGRFSSTVATSDGRPVVAYFGLPEDLPEGEIADTRPIGAPSIPGVLLATRNSDGVWSRGAIALAAAIPNVDIAFAPAFDDAIGKLTAGTVTGLDLAIDDSDGLHAVWGSVDGLWYASGSADPASTTKWTVDKVFDSPPQGVSLAVTGSGSPYITFVSGGEVLSAEGGPGSWRLNPVAPAGPCSGGCVTDTAVADGSPAIVFETPSGTVALATGGEGGWSAEPIGQGGSPSITADGKSFAIAYASDGAVSAARPGGDPVEVATIAGKDVRGTSVGVDASGTVSVAWSVGGSGLAMSQGDLSPGGGFDPVSTGAILGATAPDLTATPDGVFVSWQDALNRDLYLGSFGEAGFAFGLPSPTIEPKRDGGGSMAPPTDCVAAVDGVATVVASGVAFTEGSCISVPAGEAFQILFDNKDDATQVGQHNIAIFKSASDLASPLFRGDLVSGPAQVTYDVGALDAGQYYFHCDVHPQMAGSVVAEGDGGGAGGAATGGGGGATKSVSAMGLAFDTSAISLPAGKASKLTFDNQDAGVPHNIAIYPSASDLANPLFRGELITGVSSTVYEIPALEAGEYYFQCDVHPTMKGTVTVA